MTVLQLPVVGQALHRRYLPGTRTPNTAGSVSVWGAAAAVDCNGFWQPNPTDLISLEPNRAQTVVRSMFVPAGTDCGDRDRWTPPGGFELLQVGDAQDFSHGPGGVRVPLVVHLAYTPETRMVDVCEIRDPDSWATETLQPGPIAHLYQGSARIPCWVKVNVDSQPRTPIVGGETMLDTRITIVLPLDVCPDQDQVISVLAARVDQALVGRRYDVKSADVETFALERHVQCVEHR